MVDGNSVATSVLSGKLAASMDDVYMVIPRREGRERWNHLNALPIQAIHDRWISQYAGHAMNVLSALKGELDG